VPGASALERLGASPAEIAARALFNRRMAQADGEPGRTT